MVEINAGPRCVEVLTTPHGDHHDVLHRVMIQYVCRSLSFAGQWQMIDAFDVGVKNW